MTTSIKITELADIGNAIAPSTLVPVVDMAGTPTTDKANLQIVGNLILGQAGGVNFVPAAKSVLAGTVTGNAQPNITSTGTLTSLTVNGNVNSGNVNSDGMYSTGTVRGSTVTALDQMNTANLAANGLATLARLNVTSTTNLGSVGNVSITGGAPGQVLRTDGSGGLSWVAQSGGGGTPGGSTTQVQFNDAGSFGGNTGFTFNKTSGVFTSPFLAGNGNGLSNIQGGNVSGAVGLATYATTANAVAGGNVSGTVANATTSLKIANGTSNVNIPALNGNVLITSNGAKTWTFDNTGNLQTAGDIVGPASANFTIFSNAGVHDFVFGSDGTFYAPDNVVLSGNSIFIGPGANTLAGTEHAVLIASSNHFAYIQGVINNVSDNGSADWVAQGHLGNDAGGWSDIGFTSSGFGDANYTLTGAGDGYLFAQGYVSGQAPADGGGNLVLSTGENGTTKDIIFGTGGFLLENEFGRISDANNALELTRTNSNINLLGGGGIIGSGNLKLSPDSTNASAYLDVFLTSGPDVHLVASQSANLIFGKDNQANVMTSWNGNVTIQSWDNNTNTSGGTWTFGGDGNLTTPGVSGNITGANVISANTFAIAGNTVLNQVEGPNTVGFYNSDANTQFLFELGSSNVWGFNGNTGGTIFPQLSVQRGDNPSGTITGQTLLFNDSTQEAIISTPDGASGTEYSQRLVINPGQGYNYGEGGDIYLWAGRGGDGSGSGGDIKIRGGQGGANTTGGNGGDGGYIRIEAGDTATTGGYPGYVTVVGGNSATIQGGYVEILGGRGATIGGDANLKAGYGTATGGNVNIWGGASGNGQVNEGHVNIQTGGNTWTFDTSGNLTTPGEVIIESNNGHGGAGYAGIMSMTNTTVGSTNPNKFIRLNSTGNLEIINSGYTTTILGLADSGNLTVNGFVKSTVTTLSSLGSAATAGAGARAFASDANLVAAGNFGVVVGGSGGNIVPVYSDGTDWRIG